ncbi:MAG: TonB family protein [Desulfovibrio sp.]|jgi:protein TonB|nr:TonB family protein [Desulfovibrio sp.]
MDGGVIGGTTMRFSHVCVSALLHACLVALLLLPGGRTPPEKVYRVALSAFPAVSGVPGAPPEAASAREEAPAPEPPARETPAPEPPTQETPVPEPPVQEAEVPEPSVPDLVIALQTHADKPATEKRERKKAKNRAAARPEAAAPVAPPSSAPAAGTGGSAGSSALFGGVAAYDADAVDRRPVISRRVLPEYPERARRQQVRGRVEVRLIVDASGNPRDCVIHRAEPAGYFEEAALEAARRTRFIPGEIKGRAVNTVVLIPFVFAIR